MMRYRMQPQKKTSSIAQKVLKTYEKNVDSFPKRKQFHFNSRMFLWTRKLRYKKRIVSLKLKETLLENFEEVMENAKRPTVEYPKRFLLQRKSALEKYPWVTQYNTLLFKWLFLEILFRTNIRKKVFLTISKETLRSCARTLLSDPVSLIALSTFGINFLYLTRGILQDTNIFHPKELLEIAKKYYPNTEEYAELSLYFFTHCIIGESRFYKNPIQNNIDVYVDMIRIAEKILNKHFASVSLDNKVEFLVAVELCRTKSNLFERIQKECERNFSEKLGQVREPRKPIEKQTLSSEEHRNVLYIMSNLKFSKNQP